MQDVGTTISANVVVEIIEALCEKLNMGISSIAELIPQLKAFNTHLYMALTVLAVIGFVASLIALIVSYRVLFCSPDSSVEYTPVVWVLIISGCFAIFCCVAFIVCLINYLGWSYSPDVYAIKYFIGLLKTR